MKLPFLSRPTPERPQVLGARLGVNPNSGALGFDVTYLLLGGTATTALALVLAAVLRGRKPLVEEVGSPEPKR